MTSKLTVIPGGPDADPTSAPAGLGKEGRGLWQRIQKDYQITDIGGVEVLRSICEVADTIAELKVIIGRDGAMIKMRGVLKEHPALAASLRHRAFLVRGLQKLGIALEPLRTNPGRPPGFSA
jgi:hypothetical protein